MGKLKRVSHDQEKLQIRSRTEIAGDGRSLSFQSVFCPRQHHSVSASECESCSEARALHVGDEQDLVRCSAAPRADRAHRNLRDAAERTPVSSVMTYDVLCVRADVSLEALSALLLERGISGLPVVDEDSRAIGIVSKTDLVRHQCEQTEAAPELGQSTVAEIMTPVALTVPEEASIASATAVMAAREIHRLPVVDDLGVVVGVLSATDIVDWVAQGAPRTLARRGCSV